MASTDDLLTAQKNGVQAFNNFSQVTRSLRGTTNSLEISTETYLNTTFGWVGSISVIAAGSTNGVIYDANSITSAITGTRLLIIPSSTAVGTIIQVNMPVNKGIVVAPGSGMILAVSYS
jgi:hypothetical protein